MRFLRTTHSDNEALLNLNRSKACTVQRRKLLKVQLLPCNYRPDNCRFYRTSRQLSDNNCIKTLSRFGKSIYLPGDFCQDVGALGSS